MSVLLNAPIAPAVQKCVFELVQTAMDDSRTMTAHSIEQGRAFSVLGYGLMRDGSKYVTVQDPVFGDDGIFTIALADFTMGFREVTEIND